MTLVHLKPSTLRECELVCKRASVGLLAEEERELRSLQLAAVRQEAADKAAESRQEGRTVRPFRTSPHE